MKGTHLEFNFSTSLQVFERSSASKGRDMEKLGKDTERFPKEREKGMNREKYCKKFNLI